MDRGVRRLLLAMACAFFGAGVSGLASAQDSTVIGIGSSTVSFSSFSTYYAADRGFFKREGLEPKMTVTKTEAAIAALNAGGLDYTTFSTSTIDAALRGFPIRLLAVFVRQPVMGLIVQPGITSVRELKGKKVAVSSFGGLTYTTAVEVFKHFGLEAPKDVTLLAAGSNSARIAGLKKKAFEGAFISAPLDIRATQEGLKMLLEAGTISKYPYGGFSTTVKKIRENPTQVKKALRAVVLATRAVVDPQNKDDVVQYIMKSFKLDHDGSTAFYERLVPAMNPTGIVAMGEIQRAIDSAVKKGVTDKPRAADQIVDFTFAREIAEQFPSSTP